LNKKQTALTDITTMAAWGGKKPCNTFTGIIAGFPNSSQLYLNTTLKKQFKKQSTRGKYYHFETRMQMIITPIININFNTNI